MSISIRTILYTSSILFVILYSAIAILWGYVMPYENFDGTLYVRIVEDPFKMIMIEGLSRYHIQRILPSLIIFMLHKIFFIQQNPETITFFFQAYNLFLIIGIIWIWDKIALIFDFDSQVYFIGILFSVFSFCVLNSAFFYPYLTDYTSLFLGYWLLWAYLKNETTQVIISIFLGSFTWPSFLYFGLICILFPYQKSRMISIKDSFFSPSGFHSMPYLIGSPFLIVAFYRIYMLYVYNQPLVERGIDDLYVIGELSIISALLNYGITVYMFYYLVPETKKIIGFVVFIVRQLKWRNIVLSCLVFSIISVLISILAFEKESPLEFKSIIYNLSILPAIKPFFVEVEAITCFGPLFIILYLFSSSISKNIWKIDIAIYFSFILFLILKQVPESRTTINCHAILVLLVCMHLQEKVLTNKIILALILMSVLFSKIYLPIYGIKNELVEILKFPNQLYFMNTYFMSNLSYYITTPFVLICSYMLYIMLNSDNQHLYEKKP